MALGFPSTVAFCLDQWVWEIMILVSGYFKEEDQAAQIIVMNIVSLAYMVAIGLEQASCTLIG